MNFHDNQKALEIENQEDHNPRKEPSRTACFIFSPNSEVIGVLAKYLNIFEKHGVNLLHIESRPSSREPGKYQFMVECEPTGDIGQVIQDIKDISGYFNIISDDYKDNKDSVPWFPSRMQDLDRFVNHILMFGAELDADHPGFTDLVYRARRKQLADLALSYRYGDKLPHIDYTEEEIATWGVIFRELTELYPKYACKEHNHMFPLLIQNCGFREDNIPQLEDVSNFLKDCTGFTLRPTAGMLSSRDFLAGLAFRVFHSTQYIRHASKPLYTPEPDICHELLGHAALFADPSFAQFAQEIGLASLGAPDEYVEKLAACFFFTVEYGLCRENGKLKAYGAGLLSSFGEMQYALEENKAEIRPFDPANIITHKYPLSAYQPVYFVAESFEDATEKVMKYASTIPRSFGVKYNPYTQRIEVLDSKLQVETLFRNLCTEITKLTEVMKKL